MVDIRQRMEAFSFDLSRTALLIGLFLLFSGISWNVFNQFSIAEPEGFDPLRYEYFARMGLPYAYADSSSYRMVLLLEYIYKFSPFYWGYILFIGIICFGFRFFDSNRAISFAIFSPIAFYYLGQTGKDGIAILAILGMAMLASMPKNFGAFIFVAAITVLAFYVRPAIALIIPVAMIQFRYGTFLAFFMCAPVLVAFSFNTDAYDIITSLSGVSGDEGAGGVAALLRTYTFGYELSAVLAKFGLLLTSAFFQPALGFLKFYFGSPIFVIYESICFTLFLLIIFRQKIIMRFLVSSLPYVIVIGATSPFYHFRYMAIIYPAIWAYAYYCDGWGWWKSSSIFSRMPRKAAP